MAASPQPTFVNKLSSLSQRVLVTIVLIPLGVGVIAQGRWPFALFVAFILGIAAWEYWHLFSAGGYQPSVFLLVGGTAALVISRHIWGFELSGLLLSLAVMGSFAVQVVNYRKSEKTAALDININLGGLLYLGWLGSYLISLRNLPDGLWWFLVVMPAIWFSDAGAYLVGSRIGRHKLAPLISPNKSWEGYLAGVVLGPLAVAGLAAMWHLVAPAVTVERAVLVAVVVAVLSPLGDLGESLLKRGFGMKDTSHILPGHGGVMDRIDSWLWAAPIGYYLIKWLF